MIRRNTTFFAYLAALFSSLFLELQYQSNPRLEAGILLLIVLSFIAIASPAIIFQFRIRRYLLVVSLPILLLTGMELAHLLEYQVGITRGGLIAVGNTGLGEAQEFIVDLHGTRIAAVIALLLYESYVEPSERHYDNGWDAIQVSKYSDVISVPTLRVAR